MQNWGIRNIVWAIIFLAHVRVAVMEKPQTADQQPLAVGRHRTVICPKCKNIHVDLRRFFTLWTGPYLSRAPIWSSS